MSKHNILKIKFFNKIIIIILLLMFNSTSFSQIKLKTIASKVWVGKYVDPMSADIVNVKLKFNLDNTYKLVEISKELGTSIENSGDYRIEGNKVILIPDDEITQYVLVKIGPKFKMYLSNYDDVEKYLYDLR